MLLVKELIKLDYAVKDINMLLRTQYRVISKRLNISMCDSIAKQLNDQHNTTVFILEFLKAHHCNHHQCIRVIKYFINNLNNIVLLLNK